MYMHTWFADTRSIDTSAIVVAVERFTFVGDKPTDSLGSDIVDSLRVIHGIVSHQHVVHTILPHGQHLASRPVEITSNLKATT